MAPVRELVEGAQLRAEEALQIGAGEYPDEARRDHHHGRERHRRHDVMQRHRLGLFHGDAHLEAHQQEQRAFDQPGDEVPEEHALQPRRRRDPQRSVPADIEPAGDGGDHAGAAEMFGHPVGEVGREQRQRQLDAWILGPVPQPQAEPADGDAEEQFAGDDDDERTRGLDQREGAGAHRQNGEAIENQRRGVVGEALAFENDENAPRQMQPPGNGQRRDDIRRGNDGAEHEADGPGRAEHVVHRRGDGAGGEDDAADGEQGDGAQIGAEFPPAHGDAGGIDQRRQQDQQHHLRRQFDARQPGNEGEGDAAHQEGDGRRQVETPRHCGDRRHRGQQEEEEKEIVGHRRQIGGASTARQSGVVKAGAGPVPEGHRCYSALAAMLTVSASSAVLNTKEAMPWAVAVRRISLSVTPTSDTCAVMPMTKEK
jgi:hypothetical protein